MENINSLLPHGFCIKWTPELLWLYVLSDSAIALAYYSIPFTLGYFVYKRKDLEYRGIFILFSLFILACGTTHLLGIVVLWNPIFWIDGSIKAFTAIISVISAIALIILVPKALKIPSPKQLEVEVHKRQLVIEKLQAAQLTLVEMEKLIEAEKINEKIAHELETTLDAIPDLLFEIDSDGRYLSVRAAKDELLAMPIENLIGKTIDEVLPSKAVNVIKQSLAEATIKGYSRGGEIQIEVPAGKCWFELSIAKRKTDNLSKARFIVLSRDITERKRSQAESEIAAIAFQVQEGVIITDSEAKILRVNNSFTQITGYSEDEVVGIGFDSLISNQTDELLYSELWSEINHRGSWSGEVWGKRKNGEVYPERLVINALKDETGSFINYVATISDISESYAAQEQIKNLAFFDPLTKLPNRRLLLDRMQQALKSSQHNNKRGAILFLDLDHFKILNDSLGHNIGDLLLKITADRLKNCVRESDTVARIGGDEFVIVLEDLSSNSAYAAKYAETVGNKVLDSISENILLENHNYQGSASIGITLFNNHDYDVEELLKQADIAMYQAKEAGRSSIRFFDIEMQKLLVNRAKIERDLRTAIDNQEFVLYYQIQKDRKRRAIGAEALIRWNHPGEGLISPNQFIPIAEDCGLIIKIGEWVIDNACAQLKRWQQKKQTREFSIAVNVSVKQFMQQNFIELVNSTIQRHEIDPAFLKLEITESLLLNNTEEIIHKILQLRKIGVRFELDDFGTGYSSLQYLKKLPLNQLKIDQSFVQDVAIDENDRILIKTIISMAHNLGLKVIAEGVENEEQRQFLMESGCDHFQGYYFGKPMPIDDFENLIKNRI